MDDFKILDACCGSRMFWYDRANPHTTYVDNRCMETMLCDGRKLIISPDVTADFRSLPFEAETFSLIVFDPPHLIHAGEKSWLAQKYGTLPKDYKAYLKVGFNECFRVLKTGGTLAFKWNADQIPCAEVIKLAPEPPLFGDRIGKTRWTIFCKGARKED